MGRENGKIVVHMTVDKHNGPEQERDAEAAKRLEEEIRLMIQADPDYARIVYDIWGM